MIDEPYVYPFASEVHLRRGRTVLRPVVRMALADPRLVLNALVDTGSEHVLADSAIAVGAGLDLTDPIDIEEIGFGGGVVEARFVEVTAFLYTPATRRSNPCHGRSTSGSSMTGGRCTRASSATSASWTASP